MLHQTGAENGLSVDKPFKNPVLKDSVEKARTILYEPR